MSVATVTLRRNIRARRQRLPRVVAMRYASGMPAARSAAFLVVICACSDDAAPRDATTVDIDNGTCGNLLRFTGEYVDWDSGAAFCGIFDAQFQVQGGSAKSSTAPNGRFDLCIPADPVVLVDITPPTMASACTTPPATYALPGIAVANKAVITAGGFWSGRGFVVGRETIDPTKAQVFVHLNGTPQKVTLTATHGPTQARMGDTWSSGEIGQEVFFPDVDPTGGETTLSSAGAIGTGPIPLVAGKMTNVSIVTK
jgi:hypothetical protein